MIGDGHGAHWRLNDLTRLRRGGNPTSAQARDASPGALARTRRVALARNDAIRRRLSLAGSVTLVALWCLLALSPRASASESGGIEGLVTAAAGGKALSGIEVCAAEYLEYDIELFGHCTKTTAAGKYSISELSPGHYGVGFFPPEGSGLNYVTQYYDGATSIFEAEMVDVNANQTVPDVNAAMAAGGEIAGEVTSAATHTAIPGIRVCASSTFGEYVDQCARTGSTGAYTIPGLQTGDYTVSFSAPEGGELNYIARSYTGSTEPPTSEPVPVEAGQTTPEINAAMETGGEIHGTVTSAATQADLAGIQVCSLNRYDETDGACAKTDAKGEYTIAGLPTGKYRVWFIPGEESNYFSEYYNNAPTTEEAEAVSVKAGSLVPDIDAALTAGGEITGQVTAQATGTGIEGVEVCPQTPAGAYDGACAKTGTDGKYTILGLQTGSYDVQFSSYGLNYLSQYYAGAPSQPSATAVAVSQGSTTPGINAVMAAGGEIRGTVVGAASRAPVAKTDVCPTTTDGERAGECATTNSHGEYAVIGLASGKYDLELYPSYESGYFEPQYYNGKPSLAEAQPVTVQAGHPTSGIEDSLLPGATITGQVIDASSKAGLGRVEVCPRSAVEEDRYYRCTTTSSSGEYTLQSLSAGSYKISFRPLGGDYLPQYYDEKASLAEAGAVTVTAGATTPHIDAAMVAGGEITGTVKSATTESALAGFTVTVESESGEYVASAQTNPKGGYVIPQLRTGRYRVEFSPPYGANYLTQYYKDRASSAEAELVSVTQGDSTNDVDAAMALGGTIAGKVLDAETKLGVEGVYVYAFNASGTFITEAVTDEEGEYAMPALPSGEYRIEFYPYYQNYVSQYFNDTTSYSEASPVPVSAGKTTPAIDATLAIGGKIEGEATDAQTGKALQDIEVCALEGYGYDYRCTYTGANGRYLLQGLATGSYRIEFSGVGESQYLTQFYSGHTSIWEADEVPVTAGTTVPAINAAMVPSGEITGKVTDVGGAALAGIEVCPSSISASGGSCTQTNSQGKYAITGLGAGEYKIQFSSQSETYLSQYYNDAASYSEAQAVSVSPGTETPNIDAVMRAGGQITGLVRSASQPIAETDVCASQIDGGASRCTSTNSNGEYTLPVLPEGEYEVQFTGVTCTPGGGPCTQTYLSQYYNDKTNAFEAESVPIVGEGKTSGIDATLTPTGKITGKVTSFVGGTGLAGIRVCPLTPDGGFAGECATSDGEGNYTIAGLSAGEYDVEFQGAGSAYLTQYYDAAQTLAAARPITVSGGETTPEINAAMQKAGQIEGKAINQTGAALADIEACASEAGVESYVYCAYTGAEGEYVIPGLPGGRYTVRFTSPSQTYTTQYYKDRALESEAEEVTVTDGAGTPEIDATMLTGGEISGQVVSAADGTRLGGIEVCPLAVDQSSPTCAVTNSDGEYALTNLPTGEYDVEFRPGADSGLNYLARYYDEAASPEAATPVTVAPGTTTPDVDAAMRAGGQITGTVTDAATESAIEGMQACATAPSGERRCATTNAKGEYAIQQLASGEYEVLFYAASLDYMEQYYDGAHSLLEATPVPVAEGETTPEIDAAMTGGSRISGSVTDAATTAPLAGVHVCASTVLDIEGVEDEQCTVTGAGGEYTLGGLLAAQYDVEFRADGGDYRLQYYHDKPTRALAEPVTLAADGAMEHVDAALVRPVAPVDSTPPTIKGTPQTGQSLVETAGTWSEEPTEITEQWLRCDGAGENCNPIAGADGALYVLTSADLGHTLRVRETAGEEGVAGTPAVSAPTAVVTAAPLRAVAGEDVDATAGVPVAFSASGSVPSAEIDAYRWNFGDGTSAEGIGVNHTYGTPGTYEATLTVVRGAETDKQSLTVTVAAAGGPQAKVTVVNGEDQPLAGAEVLYEGAGATKIEAPTDDEGVATLEGLPDGTDTVYVYAKNYKPLAGQISISEGAGQVTLTLTPGPIGAATLKYYEMTLEEIETAGINPNDPANRQVFAIEAGLKFAGAPTKLRCYLNKADQLVGNCTPTGGGGGECDPSGCHGPGYVAVPGETDGHPYIQWLILQGKAAMLKQFFAVSMVVQNLSPEPFELTQGNAALNVPPGISLAPTPSPQSATQDLADIPGEGSVEANWIVRGDEPGEYRLSATYHGQLEPFAAPVELQAALATPLKVWGAEALGFHIQADEGSLQEGVPYHVHIGIYDKADIPLYNVAIDLDGSKHEHFIYQPGQQFEAQVGELKPGETLYAPQDILVPDADSGEFEPQASSARFVGETTHPSEHPEAVKPPALYTMSATLESPTLIHLHWQPSPGAQGYEIFSTPDLDTSFATGADAVKVGATSKTTVTRLPASATDAYVARAAAEAPRFYAVTTIVGGGLRLEHPVREPSIQGPVGGPLTLRELLSGGENPSEFCLQCAMNRIMHADPVDAPTGDFWHSFTDLSVPGRGIPLDLTRTYNSGAANTDGPFGYGWSFSYGTSLSFPDSTHVVVTQENGSQVTFSEEPDGSYTAPPRVTATLVHNGDGTWTFVRHRRETLTFDSDGRLTGESDLDGYLTSLAYNSSGQLQSVTDPAGRKLQLTYEGGHISEVTDPLGRVVRYSYDAAGDLTDVTDVAGGDTHFTYDSAHRMLTLRTPDQAPGVPGSTGATVTNSYDSQGRVVEQTDQLGRATKFAYSGEPLGEAGGTTTITDPKGNVTVQSYRYGELVSETRGYGTPQAATWKFEYDQTTLGLASVTDPEGHTTTSTYDAEGNLLSSEDALKRKTVDTYDSLNDLLTSTDPTGVTTTYAYDSHGNLLSTSRPLTGSDETQKTTYTYGDPAHPGDVTAMTDPDGATWKYAYDADGNRISATDPLGNTTTYGYNAIGWLKSTTSPSGNLQGADPASFTTTYAHNAFGQVTETVDPLGHRTTDEYDPDQNLIATEDAKGNVTRYSYDAADERTAVHQADGTTLRTTYWPDGTVKEQVDGAGHATDYEYDPLGLLAAVTDPRGRTTRYGYDRDGDETSTTDPEGQVTTKTYDADGEFTGISYSDGKTPDVSDVTYDADGERTGMTDGSGSWSWSWDSLHRLRSVTEGTNGTVSYEHDLRGAVTAITYPNGKTVKRSYDAAGDLTGVSDWLGNTTTFGYDPDADLSRESYPGGVDTQLGYDDADRLTSIADSGGGQTLASFDYTRNPNGEVENETADNGGQAKVGYAYDSLNQLTAANATPYGYDAAENPTTFGSETTQEFDAANELTQRTEPGPPTGNPGEGTPGGEEEPSTSSPGSSPPPSGPSSSTGPASGAKTSTGLPAGGVGAYHATYVPPTRRTAVHSTSTSGHLTSPGLRTHGPHELLLAFVSASGPSSGDQQAIKLSGGGLHWSPVARQTEAGGDSEIWQARATHAAGLHISARLRVSGYPATLAIGAYGGTAYVEAHTTSHGRASAPAIELPGVDGTLVVAVGNSSARKTVEPTSGQQLLAGYAGPRGTGWVQQPRTSSATGRIADAKPAPEWGMAAVAIASRGAQTARETRTQTARAAGAKASRAAGTQTPPATTPVAAPAPATDALSTAAPAAATDALSPAATGAPGAEIDAAAGPTVPAPRSAQAETAGVTRSYTYDERGDRTGETVNGRTIALRYDQANRLVGVGESISYTYNGDGLRMSKTVAGHTTAFAWEEAEELPELLQDGSTYYIYGPEGTPIEQISGDTATYMHQDQQGSTRLLTDSAGAVVGRYDYDAWGKVTSHTGSASTDLQYDGQYTDPETGFQYLRARYYDPGTGQFLTIDPAFGATQSRYGYAANEPLDLADVTGLSWWNPFSWSSRTWRTVSLGVATVGALAAGCLVTFCTADAAIAGVSVAAIATASTVASTGIDVGLTAYDCYGGGERQSCTRDVIGTVLDVLPETGEVLKVSDSTAKLIDASFSAFGLGYDYGSYFLGGGDASTEPQGGASGGEDCYPVTGSSGSSSGILQPAASGNLIQP